VAEIRDVISMYAYKILLVIAHISKYVWLTVYLFSNVLNFLYLYFLIRPHTSIGTHTTV